MSLCDEIDLCDVDFYTRALQLLATGAAEMVVGSKGDEQGPTPPAAAAPGGDADHKRDAARTGRLHGTDTHGLKAFRRDRLLGTVQRCVVDKDLFASSLSSAPEREARLREIPVHIAEKRPPSINLVKRVPNVLRNLARLTYIIRIKGWRNADQ